VGKWPFVVESLKGQLLIASADLFDENFRRTVVLITEHDDDGALGLVLNRPAQTTVVEAVPGLEPLVDEEDPVYVGGPVDQRSLLVLAEFDDPDESASTIFEDVGFIRGDADIPLIAGAIRRARVFAGYAGWTAGQLDAELEAEGWILADPEREDVFGATDGELWSEVLRRKGGPYALLATMPPDPSLN
jgi:putative transcriptional regulator